MNGEVTFKLSNPDGLTLEEVRAFVDEALERGARQDAMVWVSTAGGDYSLQVDVPEPLQDALL